MNKTMGKCLPIVATFLGLAVCLFPENLFAQYTEKDIYDYINQYGPKAVVTMREHKIPASITVAQGIFESGCGKSRLAAEGNNHFGIKCHEDWTGDTILIDDDELQECFRKYPSVEESYNDHAMFLKNRKRYANLFQLDIMDYAGWARTLKADGYATNPQYAERLISLIERFGIAQLDTLSLLDTAALSEFHLEKPANPIPPAKPIAHVKPEKPTQPVKTETPVEPAKPAVPITPPVREELKTFTAKENEYPAGSSPFSYRKVFENNHTYFVIAQKGDTYEAIAEDVQVDATSLRKFNDVMGLGQPVENEVVYVEAKAKTNTIRVHKVEAGETLRYIAQRYGVQLSYIFKYNALDENSIIHPGDHILLRH